MRIQYISDIHLEHYKIFTAEQLNPTQWIQPDPAADILVLAGDIGNPNRTAYGLFLEWCSANWPEVVIIAGNHEFYSERPLALGQPHLITSSTARAPNRFETMELIRKIASHYTNLHVLDRDRYTPRPGLHILGCSLWSDIPADMKKYALQGLNDFRMIPGMTFESYAEWHAKDLAWLTAELSAIAEAGETAVVVTHHMPSPRLIAECYQDHPLNCCFATDLEALILRTQPAAWICGHSHTGNRIELPEEGGCNAGAKATILALNPYGYPGEKSSTRNREAIIELALPQPQLPQPLSSALSITQ